MIEILFFILIFLELFWELYILQLKSYFSIRFLKYSYKSRAYIFKTLPFLLIFLALIFNDFHHIFNLNILKIFLIIFLIINIILNLINILKNKKIKFKITKKIVRLLIFSLIFAIFSCFLVRFLNNLKFLIIIYLFEPVLISIFNFLDIYKYFEFKKYLKKSREYISKHNDSVRIGITGSNGKTSVKNILYEFLKDEYLCVKSPKNFNTPQGLTWTITKMCDDKTQCMIFEMGARRRGDIKMLANLCDANYGIITTIAPQHIETFKSIKNVYETKKELSDYLNEKFCVYNYSNIYTRKMFIEKKGEKAMFAVFTQHVPSIKHKKYDIKIKIIKFSVKKYPYTPIIYAKNIKFIDGEMYFDMFYKKRCYRLKTRMLGEHNVANILASTLIALKLNVKLRSIIKKIGTLSPTPHRLELIRGRINILDDSYNCSIESAKYSLKILGEFSGKKMVCTPGIIEGGKKQMSLNITLAEIIKRTADYVIIVGKTNKKAFQKVLKGENYFYVKTLDEAKKYFSNLRDNDTLLILNDLTDEY